MVNLWDAGIVLDAAVRVDSLLVHVAAPVIRGHYSTQLTVACSSNDKKPNEKNSLVVDEIKPEYGIHITVSSLGIDANDELRIIIYPDRLGFPVTEYILETQA